MWLNISFRLRDAQLWAEIDHEVTFFQQRLTRKARANIPACLNDAGSWHVSDQRTLLQVTSSNVAIHFSKRFGSLESWKYKGQDVIIPTRGPALSFWRAPTDNDLAKDAKHWTLYGLHDMKTSVHSVELATSPTIPGTIQIHVHASLAAPILSWAVRAITEYVIFPSGQIMITTSLKPTSSRPSSLPRVGWELSIPLSEDGTSADRLNCEWFGRGPGESYKDKKLSQRIGIFNLDAEKLHTPYEVPQENGNRMDTRWARFYNVNGPGLVVNALPIVSEDQEVREADLGADCLFSFAASRYSSAELTKAKHPSELVADKAMNIRLDFDHHGLGTEICGPAVLEEYRLKCEEMSFRFLLGPSKGIK